MEDRDESLGMDDDTLSDEKRDDTDNEVWEEECKAEIDGNI